MRRSLLTAGMAGLTPAQPDVWINGSSMNILAVSTTGNNFFTDKTQALNQSMGLGSTNSGTISDLAYSPKYGLLLGSVPNAGALWGSYDWGNTWTQLATLSGGTMGYEPYGGLIWNDKIEKFIAVSNQAYYATSNDGKIWTTPSNGMPNLQGHPAKIAFDPVTGRTVVATANGSYTSTDGVTWTNIGSIKSLSNTSIAALAWSPVQNKFFAVINQTLGPTFYVYSSTGSSSWVLNYTSPSGQSCADMAIQPASGKLVITDPAGAAYQSSSSTGSGFTTPYANDGVTNVALAYSPGLQKFLRVGYQTNTQILFSWSKGTDISTGWNGWAQYTSSPYTISPTFARSFA